MSLTLPLPFGRLMLLLEDPARLAALLTGSDPPLALPGPGGAVHAEDEMPMPAAGRGPPAAAMPVDVVPTTEAPDVMLLVGDARSTVPDLVPPAAPNPGPLVAPMPEDAFPTIAELDAMLAESYAAMPGTDAALRAELAAEFGLDPALVDDEEAFMAALAALEPPPGTAFAETVSGEPLWDPAWVEAGREAWGLG